MPEGLWKSEPLPDRRGQYLAPNRGDGRGTRVPHAANGAVRLGLDLGRSVDLVERPLGGVQDHEHVNVADVAERELADGRVDDVHLGRGALGFAHSERLKPSATDRDVSGALEGLVID